MDLDLSKLLSIAIEWEHKKNSGSGDDRLAKVLDGALKQWQKKLNFISFATAFRIKDKAIGNKDIFNELKPKKGNNEKYDIFKKLTICPKEGKGRWPWQILRPQGEVDKSGIFPPQILLLKRNEKIEIPSFKIHPFNYIPIVIDSIPNNLVQHYKDSYSTENFNEEKESWRWYAAYPAVLGDEIRVGKRKETEILVYVLGTRQEFKERQKDYGLIVGLTKDVFDTEVTSKLAIEMLSEAIYNIIAAWNILAVAPHILEDGIRISELQAVQKMTHVFRTNINKKVRSKITNILSNKQGYDAKGQIESVIDDFEALTSLMHFVSKEGIKRKPHEIRSDDIEEKKYALLTTLKTFFDSSTFREGIEVFLLIPKSPNNEDGVLKDKWVKWSYLEAILVELVANINMYSPEKAKVEVILTVDYESSKPSKLTIKVINPIKEVLIRDNRAKNKRFNSGEEALNSFFQALGGSYEREISKKDKNKCEITMTYNLAEWLDAICSVELDNKRAIKDTKGARNKKNKISKWPELEKKPPDKVALRILLLDDEFANPETMDNELENIFNSNIFKVKRYYRKYLGKKGISYEFHCLAIYLNTKPEEKHLGLEIVLCDSIILAKEYLVEPYFDITLLDIDFSNDPLYQADTCPRLGGLLFGMIQRKYAIQRVFTAKDPDLVKNPDYAYLKDISDVLGNLRFFPGNKKEIRKHLQIAFCDWCEKMLPKLRPNPSQLRSLAEQLERKINERGVLELNQDIEFAVDRDKFTIDRDDPAIGKALSFYMIFQLIGEDEPALIKLRDSCAKHCCGHALVNYLFTSIAHNYFEIRNFLDQDEDPKFYKPLKETCKFFDVDYESMLCNLKTSNNENELKKYYRISFKDHGDLFEIISNDQDKHLIKFFKNIPFEIDNHPALYFLKDNPQDYLDDLKNELRGYLLTNKNSKLKIFTGYSSQRMERVFVIKGDRKKGNYFHVSATGNIKKISNFLENVITYLDVIGPIGAARKRSYGEWEPLKKKNEPEIISDTIEIRLIVHEIREHREQED